MSTLPSANIPIYRRVLNQPYHSLFSLSGGRFWYVMDASGNNVRCYLPLPVANTKIVFVRADAGTSGYYARVYGKSTAPLNGETSSTTAYVGLALAGDAVEVVCDDQLDGWITLGRHSTVGW